MIRDLIWSPLLLLASPIHPLWPLHARTQSLESQALWSGSGERKIRDQGLRFRCVGYRDARFWAVV